jgi:DNA mismatch endonuclease (patch repair protein)
VADFLSRAERSARMARIRSSDTAPEIALRRAIHRLGLRYVLHKKGLPGKPDLVFPRHRAIVLVHGCFWHRHQGCKIASEPKSNIPFWREKFDRNVARDRLVIGKLQALGWRVFLAWECELSSTVRVAGRAESLATAIRNGTQSVIADSSLALLKATSSSSFQAAAY